MRGRRQLLSLLRRWDKHDVPIPRAELFAALDGLSIGSADLADVIGFDDACYRRTIIHSRPHYQVLVLCWRSGQRSPIHNHRGSSCVVRVLQEQRHGDPFPSRRRAGALAPIRISRAPRRRDDVLLRRGDPPDGELRGAGPRSGDAAHLLRSPAHLAILRGPGDDPGGPRPIDPQAGAGTVPGSTLAELQPARPMGRKVKGGTQCPT